MVGPKSHLENMEDDGGGKFDGAPSSATTFTINTRKFRRRTSNSDTTLGNVFKVGLVLLLSFTQSRGGSHHQPHCEWSLYQDIERLNCDVGPGQNVIVEEEVNGIGPEHAKSLWVQCSSDSDSSSDSDFLSDDYYSASSRNTTSGGHVLSHGVFMAVQNLRELKLDSCRITGITPGAFSFLPYLRNLTIQAHTSLKNWASSGSGSNGGSTSPLDIKPGVFRGLNELRHLDLATTSLSSLPNDFLCFLPALTSLNMSSCWLRDFRSIGIIPSDPTNPHNCGAYVTSLDLSWNHFTLLPPATFASVANLEELRLDMNSITLAAERALLGLTRLEVISLSGNQISSLSPEFFKDNRELKEIYLQNNSLTVLAPGLFSGLEYLVVLDLSNNELTSDWVTGVAGTFRGLVRLIILNLSHNELTEIDSSLFQDLTSLQVLNLENNKIKTIRDDGFAGMFNVHSLLLSHNQLNSLDKFVCNGLFVLSFLAIDNNKIESVAADSFKNCSNLVDLNLSGNKLTRVPSAISGLSGMKTLDLGENKISDIGNASYQGLESLYGLRLTDNSIVKVPANAFLNLPSLKIINLAKNNITTVEPGAFDKSPSLQAVRLDSNSLSAVRGLFSNIPNLLWLNISGNSLVRLDYEDFPPRLQWLDLRNNKIATLGTCVEKSLRIRNLDLSHNSLTEIGSSNLPDSIENLVLSHNRIAVIQPYTFFRKPNLTRVDLSSNQLVRLDQNAFRLSPDRATSPSVPPPLVELLLGSNPLQCDCTMDWLQNMSNNDQGVGHYPVIQDPEDVKCSLALNRRVLEPVRYQDVDASQFLCKYESHCFSACNCCDFDACDCEMTCPKNCTCYHDQAWGTNLVDCSLNDVTVIPGRIPMDVTELYLDGNLFPVLDSHSFIGRKNLRSLYLNSSRIEVIQNRTFYGLRALRILHLENNFIERLDGYEFEDLDGLQALYLQHNSLKYISNGTFQHMTNLKILYLHGNNFVDLPVWRSLNPVRLSLYEVTLRGNEWSCECGFATEFKDWLGDNRAKVSDANSIQCVDQVKSPQQLQHSDRHRSSGGGPVGVGSELIVVKLLDGKNHRCGETAATKDSKARTREHPLKTRPDQDSGSDYLVLIAVLASVLVVLVVVAMLVFYWRENIKVWAHAQCGLRLGGGGCGSKEGPGECDKLFDAFVSYSSKDEAWVRQVLAAELERNDPPYRLCLRYRDLPTGGTYLADTIVQASEASRRTVLVLSHHFLKGEWGRTDVKSAHHSVLKDRSRKVIIILLGDLPSKDLDPDIRLYLKNHTYLNCEDKRFWQKLRFALPDVRSSKAPLSRGLHARASNTMQHHNNQHNHNNYNNSLHEQPQLHHTSARGPPPPPPPMLSHPHYQTLSHRSEDYATALQQQQLLQQHQQLLHQQYLQQQQQQQHHQLQQQQHHPLASPMNPPPPPAPGGPPSMMNQLNGGAPHQQQQHYHLTSNGMMSQNNLNSLIRNGGSRSSVNSNGSSGRRNNRHMAIHI